MSQHSATVMSPEDNDPSKRYGSADSDTKPPATSSSGPKKRASRAGTRSVSNLTPAQLERKRANDREAQRAIRQRQKDHTDTLERRIQELSATLEGRDRDLVGSQGRIRELEQENAYLRSRMGNDAFLMQLPNTDPKPADSAIAPSANNSPQVRFPSGEVGRAASEAARQSLPGQPSGAAVRPEAWRQSSQAGTFSPSDTPGPSSARVEPPRNAQWRSPAELNTGQVQLEAQRPYATPTTSERPQWAAGSNYNYMVESGHPPPGFGASKHVMGFQGPPAQGAFAIQSSMPSAPPTQPSGYTSNLNTPSTEFSNLSMQSPATHTPTHEHHAGHGAYEVPAGHIPPGGPYQGPQGQSASISRTPMAPPASYNQPTTSTGYPQPGLTQGQHMSIEYQGQPGQQGYPYPQYHGNG